MLRDIPLFLGHRSGWRSPRLLHNGNTLGAREKAQCQRNPSNLQRNLTALGSGAQGGEASPTEEAER